MGKMSCQNFSVQLFDHHSLGLSTVEKYSWLAQLVVQGSCMYNVEILDNIWGESTPGPSSFGQLTCSPSPFCVFWLCFH